VQSKRGLAIAAQPSLSAAIQWDSASSSKRYSSREILEPILQELSSRHETKKAGSPPFVSQACSNS
jgi:hypothetical protein